MTAIATNLSDELAGKRELAELRTRTAELLAENKSEREKVNARHAAAIKKEAANVERAQWGLENARAILRRAQTAAESDEKTFARRDDELRSTMQRTAPPKLRAFIEATQRAPDLARSRFKVSAFSTDRRRLDGSQPERIETSNADQITAYVARVKEARAAAESLLFKSIDEGDLAAELQRLRDMIGDLPGQPGPVFMDVD